MLVFSLALAFPLNNKQKTYLTYHTIPRVILTYAFFDKQFSQFKSKVGNILAKAAVLRITLYIDGTPITSKSHTHPSHSQTSR